MDWQFAPVCSKYVQIEIQLPLQIRLEHHNLHRKRRRVSPRLQRALVSSGRQEAPVEDATEEAPAEEAAPTDDTIEG